MKAFQRMTSVKFFQFVKGVGSFSLMSLVDLLIHPLIALLHQKLIQLGHVRSICFKLFEECINFFSTWKNTSIFDKVSPDVLSCNTDFVSISSLSLSTRVFSLSVSTPRTLDASNNISLPQKVSEQIHNFIFLTIW